MSTVDLLEERLARVRDDYGSLAGEIRSRLEEARSEVGRLEMLLAETEQGMRVSSLRARAAARPRVLQGGETSGPVALVRDGIGRIFEAHEHANR